MHGSSSVPPELVAQVNEYGGSLKPAWVKRLLKLHRALDQRGMVGHRRRIELNSRVSDRRENSSPVCILTEKGCLYERRVGNRMRRPLSIFPVTSSFD